MITKLLDESRAEATKLFLYVLGGIYLLNAMFATLGGGACNLGLPHFLSPMWLAWIWSLPVVWVALLVAHRSPTSAMTRHVLTVAIGLLCTLTPDVMPVGYGNTPLRIEGHFIFFVALVFLAQALDPKILWNFAAIVGIGHTLMGVYAPMCIYGVPTAMPIRGVLHAGFVGLQVLGLLWFIKRRVAQLHEHVRLSAFEKQSDLLSAFVIRLPIPAVMTDLNMTILAVSDEWRAAFNVPFNGLVGKSYYDVVKVSDRWKENHKLALAEGHSFIYRDDSIEIGGKIEYVNRKLVPWFSEGKVAGLIAVTQFITGEVNARAELERIHVQVDELEVAKDDLLKLLGKVIGRHPNEPKA